MAASSAYPEAESHLASLNQDCFNIASSVSVNHSPQLVPPRYYSYRVKASQLAWQRSFYKFKERYEMMFQDLRHTSPKNHILPLSERESALSDAKPQAGNNKKVTSQSMHFIKLEYTYHGPVIYFLSCRATNIIQLFLCYLFNWAHNVWKSHGTTVTSPGRSGFMLNSEDTILLVLVSAKTLQKQGGDLQSNAKVSNTHHIFKKAIIDLCKDI